MKIAVALIGASYNNNVGPNGFNRDWNLSKDSIKNNIINPLKQFGDVSVYVTTYDHDQVEDIEKFYDVKDTLLIPYDNSHQRITYYNALQRLHHVDVDFIIATRFDINFFGPVSLFNFNFDKINFIFKDTEPHWSNTRYVGDCFFGIPKKYLSVFVDSIMWAHDNNAWYMHPIYNYIVQHIGEDNVNFLVDGNHPSNENQIYELKRA